MNTKLTVLSTKIRHLAFLLIRSMVIFIALVAVVVGVLGLSLTLLVTVVPAWIHTWCRGQLYLTYVFLKLFRQLLSSNSTEI